MVNHNPSFEKKIFNYFDFKYNVLDGEWYAVAKKKVGLKLIINIDESIVYDDFNNNGTYKRSGLELENPDFKRAVELIEQDPDYYREKYGVLETELDFELV